MLEKIFWKIRAGTSFSAPFYKSNLKDFEKIKSSFNGSQRERFEYLYKKYSLYNWYGKISEIQFKESLFQIDTLDQLFEASSPKTFKAMLDLGSKNWSYLPALHSFCGGCWTGIELDGNQRYLNLSTRAAHAKRVAKDFGPSEYIVSDILNHQGSYDFITWFLPFISLGSLKSWGLPEEFYKPEEMMRHVHKLLMKKAFIVIVNQGEKEYYLQEKLLKDFPDLKVLKRGKIDALLSPFTRERYGWLLQKI